MEAIIEKAKKQFLEMVGNYGSDPYCLLSHVPEAEKWVRFMLKKYPQADEDVMLLSVWLHDIGHYPIIENADHAIMGEEIAKKFLEENNYSNEKKEKVLHCVRAHRCRDVMPESLEAKIMACIDSASHLTDFSIYSSMAKNDKESGEKFRVYAKMERDWRDISAFPEIKKELEPLYDAWKKLIKEYKKIDLE